MTIHAARAAGALLLMSVLVACGSDTGPSPSTPQLPRTETSLALGTLHTCALNSAGKAFCWGRNINGQLGDGTVVDHVTPMPVVVPAGTVFTQIAASNNYTCAVTSKGELYCWGTIPPSTTAVTATPQLLAGAPVARSVTAGWYMGCVLDPSGAAFCWGQNTGGQLGVGDSTARPSPTAVKGGLTFQSLSTGLSSACGLSNGQAYCWGNNAQRVTGIAGLPNYVLTPTASQAGVSFTSLVTGATLSCGLVTGGATQCWGQSYYGSGGFGLPNEVLAAPPVTFATPTPIAGSLSWKQIAPGTGNDIFDSTCGLTTDGTAYCWGINSAGQLGTSVALPYTCNGLNADYPCTNVPALVTTSAKFLWLASGAETACGVTTSHTLMCWGRNGYGEVGDGSTVNQPTPVVVAGGLVLP